MAFTYNHDDWVQRTNRRTRYFNDWLSTLSGVAYIAYRRMGYYNDWYGTDRDGNRDDYMTRHNGVIRGGSDDYSTPSRKRARQDISQTPSTAYGDTPMTRGGNLRGSSVASTMLSSDPTGMGIVSNYANVMTTWRHKRESRRHRSRRTREMYEAQRAKFDSVASQTMTRTADGALYASTLNQQLMFGVPALYSFYGTSATFWDDIWDINTKITTFDTFPGSTATGFKGFLHFESARQVIELVNVDTAGVSAYIDCYEYYCKKDCPVNTVSTYLTVDAPITGSSGPSVLDIGTTPFQCQQFVKHCTLTNKKTFLLTPGQTVEFELKDTKRKSINCARFDGISAGDMWGVAGWTKGYIFVLTGQATATAGLAAIANLRMVVRNSYVVKFVEDDQIDVNTYTTIT